MKNSNEPTDDEIIALNDSMEQASWDWAHEPEAFGLGVEPYGEDEYFEPDFEDDDSALASAGFGMDEDYGYIGEQGFYEYED
mgnify:CR=1 FL=1